MPHSPFTRWLAITIVVLFGTGFFWRNDTLRDWSPMLIPALFLLLMIFAWSAARGAPALDDEAFHRTLPPGDGAAWRRVAGLPIVLLGIIGLLVISYCIHRNFDWKTQLSGALWLTVPLWALMSGTGIAGTFSTARGGWKVLGPALVLAGPCLGILLLFKLWVPHRIEESHTAVTAITAAVVYPAIWWLVAVKRQVISGGLLVVWTGALIPWLQVHGDFVPMPQPLEIVVPAEPEMLPEDSPWRLTRKRVDDTVEWLGMEDLIEVEGLSTGEFLRLSGPRYFSEVDEEGSDDPSHSAYQWTYIAQDTGGRILWGEEAVWSLLRSKLPAHESFSVMRAKEVGPTKVSIRNPNYRSLRDEELDEESAPARTLMKAALRFDDFNTLPWYVALRAGVDWRDGGSFELGKGGRYRLPGGGVVEVPPLTYPNGDRVVVVRRYHENPTQAEKLWFGRPLPAYDEDDTPRLLLFDEARKQVIALGKPGHSNCEVFFGRGDEWSLSLDFPRESGLQGDGERLKKMRLHVFFPMKAGKAFEVELPPP